MARKPADHAVVIQAICTTWTKASRGGAGAAARSRVPRVMVGLPLPERVGARRLQLAIQPGYWLYRQWTFNITMLDAEAIDPQFFLARSPSRVLTRSSRQV
jgi:hypothetical protein